MTLDLLEMFGDAFQDINVVLDSYVLNKGYYYLFKKDGTFEKLFVEKKEEDNSSLYEYLKIRDLYSNYISSDKAVFTNTDILHENKKCNMLKKICNNNPYTLFFKSQYVEELCNENEKKQAFPSWVFEKGIDKFFESLVELGAGNKKTEKEIMEIIQNDVLTQDEIMKQKSVIIQSFYTVLEDLKNVNMPKNGWVKIFLEFSVEEYEKASNKYLALKLFNKNDANIRIGNKIFGINNYNFNTNSKKPYLELKTTSFKIASRVDIDQIKVLRNLYLWLSNNGRYKTLIKLPKNYQFKGDLSELTEVENKNIYLLRVVDEKGTIKIQDFEQISNYTSKIRGFECNDYIGIPEKANFKSFHTDNIYALEWYINNTWITTYPKSERNYIRDSYYDYKNKIGESLLDNWKKRFLEQYSKIIFEMIHKENGDLFYKNLDKMAQEVLENTIISEMNTEQRRYLIKSKRAINLWIALDLYFNRKGESLKMKMNTIAQTVQKIVIDKASIKTDEEYYYLVGQVAYYLFSKSEASKISQDIAEPIIKSNNIKKLKRELEFLYDRYKHAIDLKNDRFNHVFSELMLKEPEMGVKDNKFMILAGLLSPNLFYQKKENDNDVGGKKNE
ncbi:MAG: hypothetical protein RR623_09745 [Bacilli bacterium]